VADVYQRALRRYGPADGELLAVRLLEEQAGLELRHGPATPGPREPGG
jgi:3-hydroxyisobutyrate dehydrogenase